MTLGILLSACATPPPSETAQETASPVPDGSVSRIGDALVGLDLGGAGDARPASGSGGATGDAATTLDAGGGTGGDAAGAGGTGEVSDATVTFDGPGPVADARTPDARGAPDARPDPGPRADGAPPPDAALEGDAPLAVDALRAPDAPTDPCIGAPPDCSALDTPCQLGVCEPGSGACVAHARADDTPCEDGEPCTANDVCEGGVCVAGGPMDCAAAGTSCRTGVCIPGTGCAGAPRPDGELCDDADPCTTAERCAGGECASGPALDCSGYSGPCAEGRCDPAAGGCVGVPHPDGQRCDDGSVPCQQSLCGDGSCGPLVPVDCVAVAGECGIGRCDPMLGCVSEPLPTCTPCDGGAGLCDGAGLCARRAGAADDFTAAALAPVWTSAGSGAWTRADGGLGNGVARSADIGSRQFTEMSRSVDLDADTPIRFRYHVTSEDGYDYFRFRIDGADVFTASGDRAWQIYDGTVPGGRHTLTFRYDKDISVDFGDDRVDVDDVAVGPSCAGAEDCQTGVPVLGARCLTCSAPDGLACAAAADPCQPGLCVAGACAATPRPDCFLCGASDEICLDGACGVHAQTVWPFEGGFPAGTRQLGDADWHTVNGQFHGGTQSAGSGAILDNDTSEFTVPVDLPAAGVVVLWVRTSTEGGRDWLYFRVDGAQQGRWAGTTAWTRVSYPIAAGQHTLSFAYEKDFSVASGSDRVWVDDVSITTAAGCR